MSKYKNKAAYEAMTRMRTQLIMEQPFFGTLLMHMGLVEVEDAEFVSTMAVDGISLYYHPPFVLGLTEPERKGVGVHEVLHVAFQHMTRRGSRHPEVWNWAGDFVINLDVIKSGYTLPGVKIDHKMFLGLVDADKNTKGHLYDTAFEGMMTEEVYDRLYKLVPKVKISIGKDGKVKVRDIGGTGTVLDAGLSKEEREALAREWEVNIRMAVAAAKRTAGGKIPGSLERLVKELNKPAINWRDLTRQWIDGNMSRDFSWTKPNRRFAANGLYLPGYIVDSLRHLLVFVDMSGSISQELAKAMVSEGAGALEMGLAEKVTIIYFDTEVRAVDEYYPGDIVTCRVIAGGGTDFEPCFQWVLKNEPEASGIIFLTDMYPNHWNLTDPGVPVLWGAYTPAEALKGINPPFGHVVHVEGVE